MKKIKFEKGITLIGLIITVILLIILVSVTIRSVNETDVIGYAQNAAEEYEEKQREEQEKVTEYKEEIKDVLNGSYTIGKVIVDVIAKNNSTIDGNEPSSNNPVIPAGFKAINVTIPGQESAWDADGGPEVNEGLVIEDEDKNQFVWVPVPEIDKFASLTEDYQGVLYNWDKDETGNTEYLGHVNYLGPREPANLTDKKTWDTETIINGKTIPAGTSFPYDSKDIFELYNGGIYTDTMYQETFNVMVKSVSKYGGFYVGRYETSLNEGKAQSKAGEIPMNNFTWYEMYKDSKTYTQDGVVSEMIWGCQWDAIMKFILTGSEASHVTAATYVGHGHINFTSYPYKTGGINYSEVYKGNVAYEDIASNIYDLEGNVYEMTQEGYGTESRVSRGGCCYYSDDPPSKRRHGNPTFAGKSAGSRLALYVEL